MTNDTFNKEVSEFLNKVRDTLTKKTKEYAGQDSDALECFKHAAAIAKTTPEKALYGFWLKHITSIADMINSGERYTPDKWFEKLQDNINYSILLYLLLEDDGYYIHSAEELKNNQPKIYFDFNNGLKVSPALTVNKDTSAINSAIEGKQINDLVNKAVEKEIKKIYKRGNNNVKSR